MLFCDVDQHIMNIIVVYYSVKPKRKGINCVLWYKQWGFMDFFPVQQD